MQAQLQSQAAQQQQQQQQMMYFGSQTFNDSNSSGMAYRKASMDQLLDSYGQAGTDGAGAGEHGLTRAQLLEIQKQRSQSTPNTPKVSTAHPPDAPLMNASGGQFAMARCVCCH